MAKSAFASGLARGAANQAGLAVPPGADFDYVSGQWAYADGSLAVLSPKVAVAPVPPSSSSFPWTTVAVLAVAGGAAYWLWTK